MPDLRDSIIAKVRTLRELQHQHMQSLIDLSKDKGVKRVAMVEFQKSNEEMLNRIQKIEDEIDLELETL